MCWRKDGIKFGLWRMAEYVVHNDRAGKTVLNPVFSNALICVRVQIAMPKETS